MDASEVPLPDCINPNNFPAKLWRLVNNPANRAICWDSLGEVVVIDRHLFERNILCPGPAAEDNADAFKTTNFSSFVRQLNLYGFRKAEPAVKDSQLPAGDSGSYHQFYNPNFKRDHPELVASLRRLTADNKAKLQAGLNVNCRPPSRYQRFSGGEGDREKFVIKDSPTQRQAAHPYFPHKPQALMGHGGTPVPPRYLIRGQSGPLSPTVYATDKGIPISLSHHYAGVGSNAVHIQQSLLARANHGNPNFATFAPSNPQYQPGFYSSVCQCYQPNLMAPHMTGGGLQTGSFSPHSYYQAGYPVNMLCCGDRSQNPQNKENQDVKKCDINLDTIFQIADEVMQTPPNSCLVRVVSPEKPGSMLVASSEPHSSTLCDHPNGNAVCDGPIILAVSGSADLVKIEQPVVSVSEKMPEDSIFEVNSDDAKDSEVLSVEVPHVLSESSQAYDSSSTGTTETF